MKSFIYKIIRFSAALERSRKRRLTESGTFIFYCLILLAVVGGNTNQNMTYQVFAFVLSLFIVSIIYSRFFRFRFQAVRILPKFATVGITIKYRVIIHNKTNQTQTHLKLLENFVDPRPTLSEFLEITEPQENKRNTLDRYLGYYRWLWLMERKQKGTAKTIDIPTLLPNSKTEVMGEITPTYRGVIRLAGLTVTQPDPFNIFNAAVSIALPQTLLVLPKLYKLPPIQLPGSRKYQSGGVALASSVGDAEEFRSLREYRPGDSPRKIHWKSWAKVGKPIVKEEQDEFFVRHALILDTFQQQLKYSDILDEAIAIAASLACEVQTQESLLDLMFVGHEAYCFTFGRGISYTEKMLEILASVISCQDKNFDSLIPVITEKISLLSGCICIFLDWDNSRQNLVNYLTKVGVDVLVLILTYPEKASLNNFDFSSMQSDRVTFRVLKLGNMQEELMKI